MPTPPITCNAPVLVVVAAVELETISEGILLEKFGPLVPLLSNN